MTTIDDDLRDFVAQEFAGKTIAPLAIVNGWITKGLITWDDDLQGIIEDWNRCNEHPQPRKAIKRFERLTSYTYCGP